LNQKTIELDELAAKLANQLISNTEKSISFLTGAGISASAGIPTFRGKDGLWKNYDVTKFATPEGFRENPELVWEWYAWRQEKIAAAAPTPSHKAISKFEEELSRILNKDVYVITQNVDGLHQRAGSSKVIELHGSIWRIKCTKCSHKASIDKPIDKSSLKCPKCKSWLRPDVVWFGEALDEKVLSKAYEISAQSCIMFVVGTSGIVFPAAYLPIIARSSGALVVDINPEKSGISDIADYFIMSEADKAVPQLLKAILAKIG